MPKLANSLPKYRHHKATGQAVVTLMGHDVYLGPHGTKASKAEYDRLVGEWLAAGRPTRPTNSIDITVVELAAMYNKFARAYYRKNGKPTGTAENIARALKTLCKFYGRIDVGNFGPPSIESLQLHMIEMGHSRRYINDNIDRIKRMFRWGVAKGLVPPTVIHGLDAVRGLAKGRSSARETTPVRPIDDATVVATIPELPPNVADMVRLQRLTGARPQEVCMLRPCDIEKSGEVWLFRPESHKTEHHGRRRVICIGPKAQAILRPYLLREKTAFCFSPAESERKRNTQRRDDRQSPMTPSQAKRKPISKRRRAPGDRYTTASYRKAIQRTIDRINKARRDNDEPELERWSPNRLRHTAATEIRKRFGLEAAQVALGHASADVSQIYAERDLTLALEVARQVG